MGAESPRLPCIPGYYLVVRVASHSIRWRLKSSIGLVDDSIAANVVFHPVASPGVCLVSPGVHIQPEHNT